MSTVFIAVQCFQCSTMQVKQRKKSGNKWNCVVCNEKQSIRKVFAQGFMAKDVRKFVQSFNMSRQLIEQQQELLEQTLAQQQTQNQPNKKRTDWSEYIDPDIDDFGIVDDEGELCEPNVVTELPKPLFKKPKLRNSYSVAGLDCEDGEKLQRPAFGKKKVNDPGKEPKMIVKESCKRLGESQNNRDTVDNRSNSMMTNITGKWVDVDSGFTDTESSSVMLKLKRPVSKWNNFIEDDTDGWQIESKCEEEINYAAFEAKVSDEIVEDDVHPDFM